MTEVGSTLEAAAELRADCSRCAGLCCVALAFARSADFAISKDAGDPCPNLSGDFRCTIHPVLPQRGFKGCTVFDCLGAGQKVTQRTFAGVSWRQAPRSRDVMFPVFQVMRQLHELLWYLNQALAAAQARSLRPAVVAALEETERLTARDADGLLALDLGAHRERVAVVLSEVSEVVRASHPPAGRPLRPGADLVGARLAGRDLRGANLRGALLIAADLRRSDLRGADLIGADLRDTDLSDADLSEALFVTQFQLNAAKGSARTALPALVTRPTHWR